MTDMPLDNFKNGYTDVYLDELIHRLCNDISSRLAPENQHDFRYVIDEIRGAVDLLVFLATTYDVGIGRNAPTVRYWHTTTIQLINAEIIPDNIENTTWQKISTLVDEAFTRLEAIALKYPDMWDDYGKPEATQ